MADDAPILHDNLFTAGVTPTPTKPSNVASRIELNKGDLDKGFAEADLVVEREFTTAPVHQGYIEPHACLANVKEDGAVEVWCATQGAFGVKQDGVPGRLAELWFEVEPGMEGIYFGQCSELCGKDHAYMPITVKVVHPDVYEEWLAGAKEEFPA